MKKGEQTCRAKLKRTNRIELIEMNSNELELVRDTLYAVMKRGFTSRLLEKKKLVVVPDGRYKSKSCFLSRKG